MKRLTISVVIALLVAIALTSFVGCQKEAAEEAVQETQPAPAPAAPAAAETEAETAERGAYEDGIYIAMEDGFSNGWKYVATITVENGMITDAEWNGVSESAGATKKAYDMAGKYNMVAYGGAQAEWYEQAALAEAYLLETQDPAAITYTDDRGHTDDIAGVSVHVIEFFELAEKALAQGPVGTGNYIDGAYYMFADEYAGSGWKEYVSLTVLNGHIAAVNWSAVNRDGHDKKLYDAAGKYNMVAYGGAQAEWSEQAARAEEYLMKVQDPLAITYVDDDGHTDAIAGVSIHVDALFDLAKEALMAGPRELGKYADGGYYAIADESSNGWTEYVALNVVNGTIANVYWSALNEAGDDKKVYDMEGNYNMVAYGGAQAEWFEQAARAEAYLLETQDPTAIEYVDDEGHTDAIAGVSIHVDALFDLAEKALENGAISYE